MRKLVTAALSVSLMSIPMTLVPAEQQTASSTGVVVVELFTSQGCSSCPSADRLLTDLAAESAKSGRAVFPISFHVDYWNRLGWEDPYSKAEFSDRQRTYAAIWNNDRIYTPQAVVNGTTEFVGSNVSKMNAAVDSALSTAAAFPVAIVQTDTDGGIQVTWTVDAAAEGKLMNIALVENQTSNPVPRGENGGRTLSHTNVVREFDSTVIDEDGRGTLTLPITNGLERDNATLVAYIQDRSTGRVLGAARAPVSHAKD